MIAMRGILFWTLMPLLFHHKHDIGFWLVIAIAFFKIKLRKSSLSYWKNDYILVCDSGIIYFIMLFLTTFRLVEKLKNSRASIYLF